MTAAVATKTIDLTAIARKLASTPNVREKAKGEEYGYNIAASTITQQTDRYPVLKQFGDRPTFRVVERNGKYYGNTHTVFVDVEGTIGLYDCALDIIEGVEFIEYELGYNGFAIVEIDSNRFKVSISLSDTFREKYDEVNGATGNGAPPVEMVREVPGSAIPLKALDEGIYTVVSEVGEGQYGNPIYEIEMADGQVQRVISNKQMVEAIEQQEGLPADISIDSKVEEEIDDKTVTIVNVSSADEESFESLDL